jgi:hypothetical protein
MSRRHNQEEFAGQEEALVPALDLPREKDSGGKPPFLTCKLSWL